jgi:gamma-glutamyltranspeptidase/glutathione hydrolase
VTADREGNVVVVTQTINHFFGAGVGVPGRGVILNNQVADFTPDPESPNAPAPGKTPLSNMAPTIVVRDGQIVVALGSPGAKRIVTALGQVLLMYLEGGLNFSEAVNFPRFHSLGGPIHIEGDRD